jgi:hypothetical protein
VQFGSHLFPLSTEHQAPGMRRYFTEVNLLTSATHLLCLACQTYLLSHHMHALDTAPATPRQNTKTARGSIRVLLRLIVSQTSRLVGDNRL